MKNSNKGFIIPVLIAVIVLLIIIGGVYIYQTKKVEAPVIANSNLPAQSTSTNQTATTSALKYTDSDFGFSFWYPSNWNVVKMASSSDSDQNITVGSVMSTLTISSKNKNGDMQPQFYIQEVNSPSLKITDNFGTSRNPTYFFDPIKHTWMTASDNYNSPSVTTIADVSSNTMGGLHLLGQSGGYGHVLIVPLSARDFLVVTSVGQFDNLFLTKTIVAKDLSVATPVSLPEQNKFIESETVAYKESETPIVWQVYQDTKNNFTFQYPDTLPPQVFVTSTSTNIDIKNSCYNNIQSARGYTGGLQVVLNKIPFCLSEGADPGAGQLYITYFYTTHKDNSYITLGYEVHTSNGCGVFKGDPSYVACIKSNSVKNAEQLIQKSVSTLSFNVGTSLVPYIGSITQVGSTIPFSASYGSTIEIRGNNFSGFEGDVYFFFKRSDGAILKLHGDVNTQTSGDAVGAQTAKVVLREPCQEGEMVFGDYSGIPNKCDYVKLTSGTYKVYTSPWGQKSNEVDLTIR